MTQYIYLYFPTGTMFWHFFQKNFIIERNVRAWEQENSLQMNTTAILGSMQKSDFTEKKVILLDLLGITCNLGLGL